MNCEQARNAIHLYLDGEMEQSEMLLLEAHLVDCAQCRAEYESLLSVVETVRASQPLYKAPIESYRAAEQMVRARGRKMAIYRGAIAASVLLVAGFLTFAAARFSSGSRNGYAAFAAEAHLRYSRGSLPLDISGGEPQVVAGWLSARLPFHLALPNYPELNGQAKRYTLVGARLLQYGEDDVAYLAYRMDGRPISLLMASSNRIAAEGGELYKSGGLSFYMTSRNGYRMITWVDKGLSYALVSDLNAAGAESCAICHGGEAERKKFEQLKPKV